MVLFLQSKKAFRYIPENESEQDILVWNKSKVPASLSSIYVPRKKLPVTTYYTIPIVEIIDPDFREFTFGGVDIYEKLAKSVLIWIRLDIPIFQEQVRYLL